MTKTKLAGSFRDPSGFVFKEGGAIFRQVNKSYRRDFDLLNSSGLYEELVGAGLLVPHQDVSGQVKPSTPDGYKTIKPEHIAFISYPYEWCFSQLKDAALATLQIQKLALARGLSLKDASAYNIQFYRGKPVLIDTLSFEKYQSGKPWVAYKQFCQHFLAPLALMAYTDVRLSQLLRVYIDGIPLDLAAKLLPRKTKLSPTLYSHIHLHAKSQTKYANKTNVDVKTKQISQFALNGLLGSLEGLVKKLRWQPKGTEWGDYYTFTNYSEGSFKQKHQLILKFIKRIGPKSVLDLGANNGLFTRIASGEGIDSVAADIDPVAVEKGYHQVVKDEEKHLLPLLMDLTNPSPGLGWAHSERSSLAGRGPVDMVFALALIHHLALSNNLPLVDVAAYFARLGKALVIEWVPKGDSQVNKLLATREDIFPGYTQTGFEVAFKQHFKILSAEPIKGSKRTLYLMQRL